MNKNTFTRLIQNSYSMSEADMLALEQVVQAFPYCHVAHMLLAKVSHDRGSMMAPQRLRKAAIHAPSRALLKKLIESAPEKQRQNAYAEALSVQENFSESDGADGVHTLVPEFQEELEDLIDNDFPESDSRGETEENESSAPEAQILAFPAPSNSEEEPDNFWAAELAGAEEEPAAGMQENLYQEGPETGAPEANSAPGSETISEVITSGFETVENNEEALISEAAKEELAESAVSEAELPEVDVEEEREPEFAKAQETEIEPETRFQETAEIDLPEKSAEETEPDEEAEEEEKIQPAFADDEIVTSEQKEEIVAETDIQENLPETEISEPENEIRENRDDKAETEEETAEADVKKNDSDNAAEPEKQPVTDQKTDRNYAGPDTALTLRHSAESKISEPRSKQYSEDLIESIFRNNELGYAMSSSRMGECLQRKSELTTEVPFHFQPELLVEYKQAENEEVQPELDAVAAQQEIINDFLKQASKGRNRLQQTAKDEAHEDLSSKSTKLNKSLVSENLAQIFAMQGKNKKAIKIYQQLQLKMPEKKEYFASQIIKLQNNT